MRIAIREQLTLLILLAALVGEHLGGGGMAVITSHQAVPLPGGRVVQL